MRLLSFSFGHDFSLCMYDPTKGFFQYIKAERELDQKHRAYEIGFLRETLAEYDFKPTAIAVDWADDAGSLWGDLEPIDPGGDTHSVRFPRPFLNTHNRRLGRLKKAFPGVPMHWVSHHYAHVLSAWLGFGTDFDYGVAIDGRAQNQDASAFFADPFKVSARMIYRSRHGNHDVSSFGRFFRLLGDAMGLEGMPLDFAGKVMGAHAYGTPDMQHIQSLDIEYLKESISEYIRDEIAQFKGERSFANQGWLDWLATQHKVWEVALESLITAHIPRTAKVAFTGGAVQNTVLNERLAKIFPNGEFIPHCYDGGVSVGSMAYLCKRYDIALPEVQGFPYVQRDAVPGTPGEAEIRDAARRLASGEILAWHQGAGEIGPRALGNRSILMNPTIPDAKATINERVKHREFWRPYAASIMEDRVQEWFQTDRPSPYMMRAVPGIPEQAAKVPAVIHEDGTCRIQTVSRSQNPVFYALLDEFYRLTGIPMLLNTSLNAGGKPISGAAHRSLQIFNNSDIDAIYIGDRLYTAQG